MIVSQRIQRVAALGGIAFVILEGAGQGFIQVGGMEPEFGAPAEEIVDFFLARNDTLFNLGGYLTFLSFITLIWFLGALWSALRDAEKDNNGSPILSLVAAGSGLLAISTVTGAGWGIAVFRIRDGLDPQIAQILFDFGNLAFATSWIFFASMLLAVGVGALAYRSLPGWLGWSSIVLAVALLLARIIWTSQAAFIPWVLFWIWLIAASIVLYRRAGKMQSATA
jgi:hypothetical protein